MVHVTEYADCGELMWATRLADSEGEYECWELLSPKAVHRVSSVSDKCMATIAPSGSWYWQCWGWSSSPSHGAVVALSGRHHRDEGRQLWEFHLGLASRVGMARMIQALWRFYAMLPPGGLRRFSPRDPIT